MRGSRLLRVVLLLVGVVALVAFLLRQRPSVPSTTVVDAGATGATSTSTSADAASTEADTTADALDGSDADAATDVVVLDELDFEPPKGRCRRTVPPGTTLATVSDRLLAAAIVEGVDVDAGTYPPYVDADHDWSARDCVGDELLFGPPSEEAGAKARWYAPLATPLAPLEGEDAGVARGPFRIARGPVLGRKMAVVVTVALTSGYDDTCFGFLALVRLSGAELVVEATTRALGCNPGQLAHLDGKLVVVEPTPPSNSGEDSAEVDADFRILEPTRGHLVSLGRIPASHSWGNGAFALPGRFVSFDAKLLTPEGPTLRLAEEWRSELLSEEDHDARAWRRKVIRTYTRDHGKLVPTPPRGPPSFASPK